MRRLFTLGAMRPFLILATSLALVSLGRTPCVHANLITNGSFELRESGIPPADVHTLEGGNTDITGWEVTGNSIDWIGPDRWQASDDTLSVDLNGAAGPGGLKQTFVSTPGQKYTMWFDLAGNVEGGSAIKEMRVLAGVDQADFSFDTTGKSATDMGWVTRTFVFTASSATTTLEFLSLTPAPPNCGPVIDNVVVEVPEPSTLVLLMMGAFGFLAYAWRRRRGA